MLTKAEHEALARQDELQRRTSQRKLLRTQLQTVLARMKNEGMLLDEELTPEDATAHSKAIDSVKAQEDAWEHAIYGYWGRLWRALLGQ